MRVAHLPMRGLGLVIERGRRARWVAVVGLALLVGVMEAVGATLVFVLVSAMSQPDSVSEQPFAQLLLDVFPIGPTAVLPAIAFIVAVFFLFRSVVLVSQAYAQSRVAWTEGLVLSRRLLAGYLRLPYVTMLRRNSAEYVRNCYDTVNLVVSQVLFPGVMVTSDSILVASITGVLLFVAPVETIVGAAVLGPVVYLLLRTIRPTLARVGQENQDAIAETYRALQQTLHGAREVRLTGAQSHFEREYAGHYRRLADTQVMRSVLVDAPRIALETLFVLAIVGFVVLVSVRSGSLAGTLSILGLFAYGVVRLMPTLNRIMTQLNHLRFGGAALAIVVEELQLIAAHARQADDSPQRLPFESEIALQGVTFRYEDAEGPALDGISLTIARGESIGVVGPTGGGKSTLLDVIVGLLAPSDGKVLVDGIDIAGCPERWHAVLGMVPQSSYLLDDTLRRNIALGVADASVEETRLEKAVDDAQLRDVVEGLPSGLDTVIGERGVRLSGGQRQRVAIARALYREPDVLVLDEGTSALDNATEAALISALDVLHGSMTLITVAHRLTTVRNCDRIVLIENGRVTAMGTYDDLTANSAAFQRLEAGEAEESVR